MVPIMPPVSRHIARSPRPSAQRGASRTGLASAVILALLLGGGWYGWHERQDMEQRRNAPVLPSVAQSGPANKNLNPVGLPVYPARLSLVTGEEGRLIGCNGAIGNRVSRDLLNQRIDNIFTRTHDQCALVVNDAFNTQLIDLDVLDRLAQLVRSHPHAMLAINQDRFLPEGIPAGPSGSVVVSAQTPAETESMRQAAADLVGPRFAVVALSRVDALKESRRSIDVATAMLARLNGQTVRPIDIAEVLNTQIINFEVDQTVIPDINKPVLDAAAALMAQTANLLVEVRGFTDADGDVNYNLDLSGRRARAVVDYLQAHGVQPGKLRSVGFGKSYPVADNVTEQGKFRNRRIEFVVVDTQTGEQTAITPATVPGQENAIIQDTNTRTIEPAERVGR